MITYFDTYRDQFGVKLIYSVLGQAEGGFITARCYRAARSRPASDWAVRYQVLIEQICRIQAEHYGVYGPAELLLSTRGSS